MYLIHTYYMHSTEAPALIVLSKNRVTQEINGFHMSIKHNNIYYYPRVPGKQYEKLAIEGKVFTFTVM